MKVTIHPSKIFGNINAPASKSSMQRACAAALIHKGQSIIYNYGVSNDDNAAINIIKSLGANVYVLNNALSITSNGFPFGAMPITLSSIDCAESGLSIRMFTPIVALSNLAITINGHGSLLTRPLQFFDEILPQLGVHIQSNNGKLPLIVKGPLQPKNIQVDGSLSSQYLTGLLLAYAAANASNVSIQVNNLKSKPYIDLTLDVMQQFGISLPQNNNYESFTFANTSTQKINTQIIHYTVEGDWSGAAFLLVAGAIAAQTPIVVNGLNVFSTQADKKILEALRDTGCILSIREDEIEIGNPVLGLKAFQFNATDCPDLFPPLVALASFCNGTSVIQGVSRLAHKESNRALTLQQEFGKLGIKITLQDDMMIIKGNSVVQGCNVHSQYDHRIAMACAVAALKATTAVVIEQADAINKSYPNFYKHLQQLNVKVEY